MTGPPPALPQALAGIASAVRNSGTSFYWAMRLLPRAKRDAMYVVYAFCREVDDIVDGSEAREVKLRRLGQWRADLDRLAVGAPGHEIARALARPVAEFQLEKEDFLCVIDGMEMDAADRLRIADMDELALYCDRVACAVGRLSTRVFGIDGESARDLAKSLGEALQLTNILRDVHEDAERDRVYLPTDLLARHGIGETDALAIAGHQALAGACAELARLAELRFSETEEILKHLDPVKVRPALIMKAVYHHLLKRLQAGGWRDVTRRIRISKLEKLAIAARAVLFSGR